MCVCVCVCVCVYKKQASNTDITQILRESVLGHQNKTTITIKQVIQVFSFLLHIKVMFTLCYNLLSVNSITFKKQCIFIN